MKTDFTLLRSTWAREMNKNSNGMIRRYFPDGMDISKVYDHMNMKAQVRHTGQSKKLLGKTPHEVLNKFLCQDVEAQGILG